MARNGYTITLTNQRTGEQVSLPAETSRAYEVAASEPGAVRLIGAISPGLPIAAVILLKADGSWHHVRTDYGHENSYYHFHGLPVRFDSDSGRHFEDPPEPTEAQRQALARWFFRDESPYGVPPGEPVMGWAFGDAPMQEIALRYGYEPRPLA